MTGATTKKEGLASGAEHQPFHREATAGFEPAMGVLQTPALPLGYVAVVLRF